MRNAAQRRLGEEVERRVLAVVGDERPEDANTRAAWEAWRKVPEQARARAGQDAGEDGTDDEDFAGLTVSETELKMRQAILRKVVTRAGRAVKRTPAGQDRAAAVNADEARRARIRLQLQDRSRSRGDQR